MNNELQDIQQLVEKFNKLFIARTEQKEQLLLSLREKEEELAVIDIESLRQAVIVMQKMSDAQRDEAKGKLEKLCTYALQYSVGDNYSVEIKFKKGKKKTNADLYIVKSNGVRSTPKDGNGGGIVDISSMSLKFVTMQVYKPFIDGFVVLDEPYKHVSSDLMPAVSEFMKNLSEDFGRQIILSTHNTYLAQIADVEVSVKLIKRTNESVVECNQLDGGNSL